MTRTTAREIAIQLGFAAAATGETPQTLLDRFFEPAYYASLMQEDELYSQLPDEKQMDYITRLVTLTQEHRDEIDEQIRRYSRGWKVERISKTKSEIDFMLTYKNMRIGVQIVAAAEHVVDDHEEGAFPYGIASGLCSEHGVESDVESDGGADLTVFAACAKLVAPNLI